MQTRSQNIRLSSTEFSPSSTPSAQTRSKNKRVIAQSNESTKESIKESRPSPYKLRKLTAVCYSEMDSESESEVEVEAFEGTRRRNPSLAVRIPSRPPASHESKAVEASRPLEQSVPPVTQLFEVNIDFDEASRAWRANKRSMGNGTYKYTCEKMISSGRKCSKDAWNNSGVCSTHKNKN